MKADKMRVTQAFIAPMAQAGYAPPTDDFALLLVEELAKFSDSELMSASTHLIRTRSYPTYPTIGEILEAVKQARDARPHEGVTYHPNEIDYEKTRFRSYIDEKGDARWVRPSWIEKQKALKVWKDAEAAK